MRTVTLTMFGILFSSAAAAQTAPRPDVVGRPVGQGVEEIVVSATRSPRALNKIGASITVLDDRAIKGRQTFAVSDLLSQAPGVTTTRNGGVGAATAVRIRGAESDQTVVVIDGVKLNDPSSVGGGYNFGNLLAGDVARIEILRGAQSTVWGSQAIGGVVNLVSAVPTAPFVGSGSLEGGSRGTVIAKAAAGGAGEGVDWRLAAGRAETDGISAFENGAERDGYSNTGLSGRLRIGIADDVAADVRAVYSRGRNEFDGFPAPLFAFADTRQFGVTRDFVGYAGVTVEAFDGRWKSRAAYTRTETDRDDFNPDQAVTTRTFDGIGRNQRGEYQGTVAITADWVATFGLENERSRLRTASPSSFAPAPAPLVRSVDTTGGYAQVTGDLAPGVSVVVGLRHDDHQTFGGHTVGQGSVAWSPNQGATVIRAGFGQGFKAPTLFQLYSAFGNTALKPESADTWDAGVEHHAVNGAVTATATVFGRTVKNQIDFFSCTTPSPLCTGRFGYYDNIAATKAHGIELALAAALDRFAVDVNYTLTDTENTSSGNANRGKDLARRPRHTANVNVSYAWLDQLTTGVGARIVGASFEDAANSFRLGGYTVIDARVAWQVRDGVEVFGRLENLFDETYSNARGYGQPGRGGFVGVRTVF